MRATRTGRDTLGLASRQLSSLTSPPAGVPRVRIWTLVMLSRMKRTEPSPMTAIAPPVWKLNGSSFGPQLLVVHAHVLGPPIGEAFWFTILVSLALGEPETPLPWSGSAQRAMKVRLPSGEKYLP